MKKRKIRKGRIIILLLIVVLLFTCTKLLTKQKRVEKIEHKEVEKVKKVELTSEDYEKNNVNELGDIPIMMYHGIHNKLDSETKYTGGNIDEGGYQRTSESFRRDLDFYYNSGYRMIRLTDYVDGIIDVELGKSPIILTFDDGLENNIKVNGLNDKGEIIIDPNSAVGILEEYKKKYKDFNVTATFFINGGMFNQKEYNEKILKWLVSNGYDIGNHTYSHVNFNTASTDKSEEEVGKIYEILDNIIPGKYVNIVALPFGYPLKINHKNFPHILKSIYNGKTYETKSTLRVGWTFEHSPFDKDFEPKYLKRIRAYDNNGKEYDIEMNFKLLESTRYISDGDKDTIVIKENDKSRLGNVYSIQIKTY